MTDLITIKEAARRLNCSVSLLQKKCKAGKIPALKVGNDYRLQWTEVETWIRASSQTSSHTTCQIEQNCELSTLLDAWISYLIHVRAFSPRTVELYQMCMRNYFKRLSALKQGVLTVDLVFQRQAVLAVYAKIPAKSYSAKMNTYLAIRSFGNFLINEGKQKQDVIEALKPLKPRRQSEPKRTHLKTVDVDRLFQAIISRKALVTDNVTFAAIVACMVYAGLRVSEVCSIKASDIDLGARVLTVVHGKGGKTRRVGISNSLLGYLKPYEAMRAQTDLYFAQLSGAPWNRTRLARRLNTLSRRLQIDVTCHGLRRTFATLAAEQGRSVNSIRIALGHSNLETTQAYLRTSEADVIREMADW